MPFRPSRPVVDFMNRMQEGLGQRFIPRVMALLWKACVVDGNVEHLPGWETGRPSEYAFQDMNLHSLLNGSDSKKYRL